MAWGYEASFTIEHDNTLKRKIDCKDCLYYDSNDKSCQKRPLYLPEDGYNSWRTCKYFELNPSVSHYEQKRLQYMSAFQKQPKYGVKDRYISVKLKNGSQRDIRLGIDKDRAYVNINEYPRECINEVRRIFSK